MGNKVSKIPFIVCLVLISLFYTSCTMKNKNSSSPEVIEKKKIIQNFNSAEQAKTDISRKEKVIKTVEEFDISNLPLISAISDRNIYLYGIKPNGVILYVEGKGHYFNWHYLTPRFILPEMNIGDYDNDGNDELAIILYVGSGTGCAVEELHIIELSEKEFLSEDYLVSNPKYFKDNFYKSDDYLNQLNELVKIKTYYKKGELMANISVENRSHSISLKPLQSNSEIIIVNGISFGDIVDFQAKDKKLTVQFALGVAIDSFATPAFIGDIYADVNYNAGKFTMSNLRF